MKKHFYLFGILFIGIAAVSLSACQKPAIREADFTEHAPLDRRIGQIDSLGGIKTSSQGTHLLKLDNGSAILLKSLNINLDDQKYRSKIVEVRGLLNYTKDKKEIMDVENIDVIDEAAAHQPVIVGWKGYISPALGFEARYRDDFQIQETPQRVSFIREIKPITPPSEKPQTETQQKDVSTTQAVNEHTISVEITPHTNQKTLLQFLGLQNDDINSLYAGGFTKSKIGTNALDAYKKDIYKKSDPLNGNIREIHFYLDYNDTFYEIRFTGSDNNQLLEDQNVFYDFVNSFKFIKPM